MNNFEQLQTTKLKPVEKIDFVNQAPYTAEFVKNILKENFQIQEPLFLKNINGYEKLSCESKERIKNKKYYHIAPYFVRDNILTEGIHNNSDKIVTQEMIIFLETLLQKYSPTLHPQEREHIDSKIYGLYGGEKRGVYVTESLGVENSYPISETVRLYFVELSAIYEKLSVEEKQKVTELFQQIHKKYAQGTDIWEISMENPQMQKYFLNRFNGYIGCWGLELGIEDIVDGKRDVNIHMEERILPQGLRVVQTSQKIADVMWTGCEKLHHLI